VPSGLIKILTPDNLSHSLKALTIRFYHGIVNPSRSKWAELVSLLLGFKQLEMIKAESDIAARDGFEEVFAPFAPRGAFIFSKTIHPSWS
jgi:hypothetical protein